MEPTNDRRISEHVLRMHRYRNPGEQDGEGNFVVLRHLKSSQKNNEVRLSLNYFFFIFILISILQY